MSHYQCEHVSDAGYAKHYIRYHTMFDKLADDSVILL